MSEKKGEGIITLVMHILKEPLVLFKLTVGVLLIVNLVVRSLLDYQQPNAAVNSSRCAFLNAARLSLISL